MWSVLARHLLFRDFLQQILNRSFQLGAGTGAAHGRGISGLFALIFIAAIPFGFAMWIRDVIRNRSLNVHGPLALAWREADRITPLIFSA